MEILGRELPITGSRRQFLRSCARKTPHTSLSDAEVAASRATLITGEMIVTYKCRFFEHFHIGHMRQSPNPLALVAPPIEATLEAMEHDCCKGKALVMSEGFSFVRQGSFCQTKAEKGGYYGGFRVLYRT